MTIYKTKEKIKTISKISIFALSAMFFLKPLNLEEKNIPQKNIQTKQINIEDSTKKDTQKTYRFFINLASFTNILEENSKAIDSAIICPGGYRKRTPLFEVQKNIIVIRPYFSPTPNEKGFKPSRPDPTTHPENPTNPLGRIKIDLLNRWGMLIRMHGTSLVRSIGRFENGAVVDYKFASNGCIRNDNISIERMIGKVIKNSNIKRVSGAKKDSVLKLIELLKNNKIKEHEVIEFSPKGYSAIVELEPKITISIRYRLWEIISASENKIILKIFVDLYNYLDNKREPRRLENYDLNNIENAYNFEHFARDLKNSQINLDSTKIKKLWQELKNKIEKNKEPKKIIQLNID